MSNKGRYLRANPSLEPFFAEVLAPGPSDHRDADRILAGIEAHFAVADEDDGSDVALFESDATVPILTHTLHYGLGVFEGIRCYRTSDERSAVFRLGDHIRRLFDSARINLLEIPFSRQEIESACIETLRRNGLDQGYIRPIVFVGEGEMGLIFELTW